MPGHGAGSHHRFLESTDFEDAIRNAISLGGDSDTLACITGGMAEAFYGEPPRD
jgi:ADP-ribosylglycohydrolase